jgi:hypothetical protein
MVGLSPIVAGQKRAHGEGIVKTDLTSVTVFPAATSVGDGETNITNA